MVDKVRIIKANAEPNQQQDPQFRNKLPPGLRKSKEIQGLTGSSSIKIWTKVQEDQGDKLKMAQYLQRIHEGDSIHGKRHLKREEVVHGHS